MVIEVQNFLQRICEFVVFLKKTYHAADSTLLCGPIVVDDHYGTIVDEQIVSFLSHDVKITTFVSYYLFHISSIKVP